LHRDFGCGLGRPQSASSYGFAQVLQSLGAENYVYRSQAEKLAEQLASNRAPSGPVDSVQLAKHLQAPG